jgi:membrane protein
MSSLSGRTPAGKQGPNQAARQQPDDPAGRLAAWSFARRDDDSQMMMTFRILGRILTIMIHEFSATHITLRASALTFTILLSLVPLLAMSTAILKGLGSGDQLQMIAYRFIDQLDPPERHDAAGRDETAPSTQGVSDSTGQMPNPSSNGSLRKVADTVFTYVDKTNFAALGAFGIAGLLITVVMVFSTMEEAMNAIWHTRRGRPLFRKIMDYLALLVLLPISINVAIAGDAILESPKMMAYIQTVIPSAWLVQMLFTLLPFLFITLTLMMMYLFFPHVRVKTLPALCGALFASIFWFLVQRLYILMQIGVAKYNAIYGSFATVPLVLIWIQVGWTFILLGAVLAYAVQNHHYYQAPGMVSKPQKTLQRAFDVLLAVYADFVQGRPTTLEDLEETCSADTQVELARTVDLLIRGGLLHLTGQNGSAGLMPSRPADKVRARDVVHLVLGHDQPSATPGGTLADLIIRAAEEAADRVDFQRQYLKQPATP